MTNHAGEIPDTESFWLRKAKLGLLQRDPVDAVNDAEALVRFAQARLDALSKRDTEVHRS